MLNTSDFSSHLSRVQASEQAINSSGKLHAAADYLPLAQAHLAPELWAYLAQGDSGRNQQALERFCIMPRPLRQLQSGHTSLTLFGQRFEHPFLLAPIAYQRLFHNDGEIGTALAAGAQGAGLVVSSLASQALEDIALAMRQSDGRHSGGTSPCFQLYWQGNRERTLTLLRRAEEAGYAAVMFTVDAPVKVVSLQLPDGIRAVNLSAYGEKSGERETEGEPRLRSSSVFQTWMAKAPNWEDVAWLRRQTELPLLIKGLLHPNDAEQAVSLGCDGIVVSNHGERVLRGAPTSLASLPAIVKTVNGRVPILFDSGIRCGRDAFVALAFGATAVMVGRPYVAGLVCGGALGVAHVIRLLRDELELTMALAGCAELRDINHECINDMN
ncbi:MAG: alpha-hydroxy-acid oxidizing protein [Burkholderiaceae bacterium]|nr:alpha-hydroxy-acid oxidizing protein [Burkholderiaceae bacterium]